jgi:D-beta-D-heptose 7-phosphate kinase/D-beta-D-heptose 1-phosphate adenosyltransferase
VLHIGHIKLFEYAKALGNKLTVGIDSDSRVKELKGNSRPINNEKNRLEFLLSIKYIDQVVIFSSEEDLCNQLIKNHIDTIVIGDDYKYKRVVGQDIVDNIVFFQKIKNLSTTNILGSIK